MHVSCHSSLWHFIPSLALSSAKLSNPRPISATSTTVVVVTSRRMKHHCLKLSQLATNSICQLSGVLAASSVSHHSKQAYSIQLTKEPLHKSTRTMTHTTLTTNKLKNLHRIPNLQVDLSHFFNSQCKNNTHFPLTYCVGCLNFYKETINSSCYHRGYLGFITKLREHFRVCSLGFRDQKNHSLRVESLGWGCYCYLRYYQKTLFSWKS